MHFNNVNNSMATTFFQQKSCMKPLTNGGAGASDNSTMGTQDMSGFAASTSTLDNNSINSFGTAGPSDIGLTGGISSSTRIHLPHDINRSIESHSFPHLRTNNMTSSFGFFNNKPSALNSFDNTNSSSSYHSFNSFHHNSMGFDQMIAFNNGQTTHVENGTTGINHTEHEQFLDNLEQGAVNSVEQSTTIVEANETAASVVGADEEQEADPEIDIVINNVVCSFSVRCHLNLRQIALSGFNVEFRRENSMVTMKLRRPYTTASIWSSGRITCTGATSEVQAKVAARRYARCLQKLGFNVRFNNFRVVNVLGTCSMPWAIKINNFSDKYKNAGASYEPELHPGVTYKLTTPKATLKIFSTGSITVTAGSVAHVQQAIEHIFPLVYEFRKKRTKTEAELATKIANVAVNSEQELHEIIHEHSLDGTKTTKTKSAPNTLRKKSNLKRKHPFGRDEFEDDIIHVSEMEDGDDDIVDSDVSDH